MAQFKKSDLAMSEEQDEVTTPDDVAAAQFPDPEGICERRIFRVSERPTDIPGSRPGGCKDEPGPARGRLGETCMRWC